MIDYLAIGHICRDLTLEGPRLGGTVTFSALTAQALGLRAAILTSAAEDREGLLTPLRDIPIEIIPAADFTTFENVYTPAGRVQTLLGHAARLAVHHVPDSWQSASIVHLAPVADEVDPALVSAFKRALIGITPQGWMRQWDTAGRVSPKPWTPSDTLLKRADAVVMSIEDVRGDESLINQLAERARLLVVTRGEEGCIVYRGRQMEHIAAPRVEVVDPTGAGDIFAAVFFARLHQTHDALDAARSATQIASDSVTRVGLQSIPDPRTFNGSVR